jgi:YHS domain-containing protein
MLTDATRPRPFSALAAGAALAILAAAPALAGSVNEAGGVAIKGYDPVAYFTEGKAVDGSPDITVTYEGATFEFASAANRDLFAADPTRYAPQYGGFCAFGTSRGYKADIDPQAFTVVGDRLYMNYNLEVRQEWAKDVPGNVAKADANWPKVRETTEVYR